MSYTDVLTPAMRRALVGATPAGRVVAKCQVIDGMVGRGLAVRVGHLVGALTEAGRREADALAGRVAR